MGSQDSPFAPMCTQRSKLSHCPPAAWTCTPAVRVQSFLASGSFIVSHFFTSRGQSIGVSASASVLPMTPRNDLQNGLVGSPCSPRDSQESSPTPQFKSINSSALFTVQLSHPYTTTGKTIGLTRRTFVDKVMSLLNIYASIECKKHLLISRQQSPPAVILKPKKITSLTVSIVSPSICHEMMGPDAIMP